MGEVMLAKKWTGETITGWWMSEKLDGVRAVWDGRGFSSRNGLDFHAPDWFKIKMPRGCVLDGELWAGRGQFQKAMSIIRSRSRGPDWEYLTYMVFDCLESGGKSITDRPFEERMFTTAPAVLAGCEKLIVQCVPMQACRNKDHLMDVLADVEKCGGEGMMLRKPTSVYERRRSANLLKVKTFFDEEAQVTGYDRGPPIGALICRTPDGRSFKAGSGLSDAQRRSPPKISAVITYRYQELTGSNTPRFPTLVCERMDLTWAEVCATYAPPNAKKDIALKRKHTIMFQGVDGPADLAPSSSGAAPSGPRPVRAGGIRRGLSAEDVVQRGAADDGDRDPVHSDDEPGPAKRARHAPSSSGPVCKYGPRCYRTNPAHFAEFAHPWLDAENDEDAGPCGDAPSARSCPPSSTPVAHLRTGHAGSVAPGSEAVHAPHCSHPPSRDPAHRYTAHAPDVPPHEAPAVGYGVPPISHAAVAPPSPAVCACGAVSSAGYAHPSVPAPAGGVAHMVAPHTVHACAAPAYHAAAVPVCHAPPPITPAAAAPAPSISTPAAAAGAPVPAATEPSSDGGAPRRTSSGFDQEELDLALAMSKSVA